MTFGEWFRVGRLLAVAPAVMGIAALACGGAQQAKAPGGGNSLETCAAAVEPDESHVWIMTESQTETPLGAHFSSSLVAVDTATGSARNVLDVTLETDRQILFPALHPALYVGYEDTSAGTHAVLLDTTTLLPLADTSVPGQLSGLRPSSSGDFAVGVDRSGYTPRERIVDTGTLLAADFPGQGAASSPPRRGITTPTD